MSDHTDTVTDVSYSPRKPVLVTGSLDCKLRAFQGRALPSHMMPKGGIPGIVNEWNKEVGIHEPTKVEIKQMADVLEAEY